MLYPIIGFAGSLTSFVLCFLAAFLSPFVQPIIGRKAVSYLASLPMKLLLCSMRIKIEVEGEIHDGSYIIASKHISWIDTIFTSIIFDNQSTILKKSLVLMPGLYNWGVSSNFIFINRGNAIKSMRSMLKKVDEVINKKKLSVLIFPEGTRTRKKQKIKGALFFLYTNVKCDVVPVAISASDDPKSTLRSLFCYKKRLAKIKILDKIKSGEIKSREEFDKTIVEKINLYIE